MAQGRGRGACLGPNVKFFWKRFLYVRILIQIYTKIYYKDANVWPKAEVEEPALGQISNFLEALFTCNNINTNLNKNFHT